LSKIFPILDDLSQYFPKDKYEKIYIKVLQYKDNFQLQYQQFSGGWRSLVYRYLACTKHSDDYIKIIKKDRISPSPFLRYEQERELFNFFTNGLSAIEELGYMLYMICSIKKPSDFKVIKKGLRKIKLKNKREDCTVEKLKTFYPEENITQELEKLTNSEEYNNWVKVRNILMHRETPGRRIRMGRKELSDLWIDGIEINDQTTACRLEWLGSNLFNLIKLTYDFTNKLI
jgi:hypothetical protein